jgi:HEAT repeat protein
VAAARSLGMIGDARAADPLIRALKNDEDRWVREAAATAIVQVLKNADFG